MVNLFPESGLFNLIFLKKLIPCAAVVLFFFPFPSYVYGANKMAGVKKEHKSNRLFLNVKKEQKQENAVKSVADGWTVMDPSKADKVLYVSNSEGDDATAVVYDLPSDKPGADPQHPAQAVMAFKTIAAAQAKVKSGEAAWILMKTGDVFYEVIKPSSGKSEAEPMVYSYYGEGTEQPLLKISTGIAISMCCRGHSNIWFIGLSFYAHTRNPDDPDYIEGSEAKGITGYVGAEWVLENILFEGCVFSYFSNNHINGDGTFRNINFRRNVFHNNYSETGRAQGLYTAGIDGILLEENIFDHNGWLIQAKGTDALDKTGGQATMHNHNTYFTDARNTLFRGNSFYRGSSMGTKWTANNGEGSAFNITMVNNLYHDNEIGISIGGNKTEPPYRFKNIFITDNVLTGTGKSNTTNRNVAWHVGIEDWDGGVFSHNLLIHQSLEERGNTKGIDIYGQTRNVEVSNNIFYNLKKALHGMKVQTAELENVEVSNNEFSLDLPDDRRYFVVLDPVKTNIFGNNTYYSMGTTDARFRVEATTVDFDTWLATVNEAGAANTALSYPAPERSLELYVSQVLGLAGMEEFYAEIRKHSKLNWKEAYSAPVINEWIREGFSRTLTITSVRNPEQGRSELLIYPNPGRNELFVQSESQGMLKLISLSGKIIFETHFTGNYPVDISSLLPGIYMVQVADAKSGVVIHRKFIIEQK